MTWKTNNQDRKLPGDWQRRRRAVLERDRGVCVKCGAPANQVDHIERGDNHDLSNLQAMCEPCHKAKTQAEAKAAQRASGRSRSERHGGERHPGMLW